MRLFRRRPRVVTMHCQGCANPVRVVAGSAPAREGLCNLCVFAEISRDAH
jgi:hypothetical protein